MANTRLFRLAAPNAKGMASKHKALIKQHGLSYAVNVVLAEALGVPAPPTPKEKMSTASKTRWRKNRVAKRAQTKKGKKTNGQRSKTRPA